MNEALVYSFESEAAYRAAIDTTLAAARKEIRIFDRDLLQMGLAERGRVRLLEAFLSAGRDRRLCIVLHDIEALEQQMPRLIDLIRLHRHLVEFRRTPDHLRHLADRYVLADEMHGAIRFHADHARGKLVTSLPTELAPWWRRFDDLWQESEVCSPGTTTGL
jgi:hypothetical protein